MGRELSKVEMKKVQNVLERVYEPRRLLEAWRQAKRNAGAAGVDQMTVEEFEKRKEQLFPAIHKNLKTGTFRFKPARRKRSRSGTERCGS